MEFFLMTRTCKVTKKRHQIGHKVSHSNIKTKRRFEVNLQEHRFYIPSEKRFIKLRVSTNGMRTIDKVGIEAVLKKLTAFSKDIKR